MVNPVPSTHTTNTGDLEGAVLPASKDTVLITPESTPPDLMEELIMQSLGALELVNLSRADLISGIGAKYSPIFNLADIDIEYSPKTITRYTGSTSRSSIDLWRYAKEEPPISEQDGVLEVTMNDLVSGFLVDVSMSVHGETGIF